jgi:hypothetical protein
MMRAAQDDGRMSVRAPTLRTRNTQIDEIAFATAVPRTDDGLSKPQGVDAINGRRTDADCHVGLSGRGK